MNAVEIHLDILQIFLLIAFSVVVLIRVVGIILVAVGAYIIFFMNTKLMRRI